MHKRNGKSFFTKTDIIHVVTILSINFLSMSGMNLSAALNNIAENFPGESIDAIQSLVTLPSIVIVFTSFFADPLSKMISKKRTILLGTLFFVVSGIFPTFFNSFAVIKASRLLIGIGIGLITPLSSTLLFDFFTDSYQRNTVLGWASCGSSMGSIVAVNLAGFLAVIDYHYAFLVHLIGLITFIINFLFLPQDSQHVEIVEENTKKDFRKIIGNTNPKILIWFALMVFYMGYLNAFSTKISILVESSGIGTTAVSAMGITLFTGGCFVTGLFYGKLSKVLKSFTMVCGIILSSIGLFSLAICSSTVLVYASGLFTGIGLCMTTPGILVGVVENSDETFRTTAIALNTVCSNLGLSFSPYLTAITTSVFYGDTKTIRNEYFVSSAALLIIGFCVGFIFLLRTAKRRQYK